MNRGKGMEKKFREMKKNADRQMKERRLKRDEEGRVILQMNVKQDDSFLSEFSETQSSVISEGVAEFIENETNAVLPHEELTLRIKSNCIDEREEKIYGAAIKEYYMKKYIANEQEIKRNRIITLILALSGIFALAVQLMYSFIEGDPLWVSVMEIVAWVLLWEATDKGLLEARVLRVKRKRFLAFLSMKIEFLPLETAQPAFSEEEQKLKQ